MAFVCAAVFLCQPAMTASAKNPYPAKDAFAAATSIKGMQVVDYSYDGIQHTLQNFRIDKCVIPADYPAVTNGFLQPYEFEGENFYFYPYAQYDLVAWAKTANDAGMTANVVFLMGWDEDNLGREYLIDEASREPGHNYYAPATSGYGEKTIRAFFSWLMDCLEEEGAHIDNFILGNEVNMPNSWHYSGSSDPDVCATKYADAFYDMYSIVRQHTSVSRCSISVDHSWNNNDDGRGVSVRDYLRIFNDRLSSAYGVTDWCISMHLYPAMLYETAIWTEPEGLNPKNADARIVDGHNLSYITSCIRDTYGSQHRIMLTEQGFTDYCGEANQAAALAYSYYAAKYDPMVDNFILNTEVAGSDYRLNFEINGKLAGEVWRRLDSGKKEDEEWIDATVLPIIGVDSWSELIPNYGNTGGSSGGIATAENWVEENGQYYWYEDGVKQGTEGRGKEVYDPVADAWYWLDAEFGGARAVGKDVYQESFAGQFADNPETQTGKWARYDNNGQMVKGWNEKNGGLYFFDYTTGAMAKGLFAPNGTDTYFFDYNTGTVTKGSFERNGRMYYFDESTGIGANCRWVDTDGGTYWYENGERQGYHTDDEAYRGKEIYDPESDAWYWLDNVQQGAVARSKDVYQESEAGEWAESEDGTGKWVRYDADGHMIKGWSITDAGTYYFDPIYGTMAKGTVTIDGQVYTFATDTGILQNSGNAVEQAEREAAEQTIVEQTETEATEETAAEQTETEATEETAAEQTETEATEETAAEQTETEATEETAAEQTETEATEETAAEQTETEATEEAAAV